MNTLTMIKDKRSKMTKFAHAVEEREPRILPRLWSLQWWRWHWHPCSRPSKQNWLQGRRNQCQHSQTWWVCNYAHCFRYWRTHGYTRIIIESEEIDDDDASGSDNDNSSVMEPYSPPIPITLSFSPIHEDAFKLTASACHSNNPAGEKKGIKVILRKVGKERKREGIKDATKETAISRELSKFTSRIPMCNPIIPSKKGLKRRNKDVVWRQLFSAKKGSRDRKTSWPQGLPRKFLYSPRNILQGILNRKATLILTTTPARTYEDTYEPPGLVSTSFEANRHDNSPKWSTQQGRRQNNLEQASFCIRYCQQTWNQEWNS